MNLKSLILIAVLLNVASSLHAVKITFVNQTGESKLIVSPCVYQDCANYEGAQFIAHFSDTYSNDTAAFKPSKIVIYVSRSVVGSSVITPVFIDLTSSVYNQGGTFIIKKVKVGSEMNKLTITKQ